MIYHKLDYYVTMFSVVNLDSTIILKIILINENFLAITCMQINQSNTYKIHFETAVTKIIPTFNLENMQHCTIFVTMAHTQ